jgi:hypothetical protein
MVSRHDTIVKQYQLWGRCAGVPSYSEQMKTERETLEFTFHVFRIAYYVNEKIYPFRTSARIAFSRFITSFAPRPK